MSNEKDTAIDVKAKEKALSNVVVLERIIEFLPITDMRSCRLVNSTWLDAATAQLRKVTTNTATIDNAEEVRSFLELWGIDDENEERPRPPFTRILLSLSHMSCEEQLLNRFFKTVAPFVVELRLNVSLTNPLHIFRNQDQEVGERLSYPNLTHYYAIVERRVAESDGLIYKPLICGILENAPNLSYLAYYGEADVVNSAKYFHWLIDTLKERKCGHKKIKTLGIFSCGMEDAHFSRMADELPELELKTVHINSGVDGFMLEEDQDGLFRFLQSQNESLKFLYLRYVTGCFESFGVPTLKKLETLHVEGWKPRHEDAFIRVVNAQGQEILHYVDVIPSVDYAKQLPALKKILFTDFDNDEWIQFMPRLGSPPVESVEVLKLPMKVNRAMNLENCIRTFPNLRILRIPATVVCVNLVYQYIPQLEELILDTCDVTNIDDIITGFSTEECAQIGRFTENMLKRLHLKVEEDEDDPEEEEPFAEGPMVQKPISVLKELKVLRLRPRYQPDKVELTKVSSRLVLAKMESLQLLDLSHRSSGALENFAEVIQDMERAGKEVQYHESNFAFGFGEDDQLDNHDDDDDIVVGGPVVGPVEMDPELLQALQFLVFH